MMLLHDCIVLCYWFLVFVVVGFVFFLNFAGKNGLLLEKIHTDHQFVWVIRISNPYGTYGLPIRMTHMDYQSI